MRSCLTGGPRPCRERGAAALLMILTLIVILTMVLAPRLTLWQVHNTTNDRGYQTLIDTKTAILAYAANPGADPAAGRRLGQILLTPDLPSTAGSTYDGIGNKAGLCATRAWVPGQALIDPNAPATVKADVRCFGRFPWLSYGLPGPASPDDTGGEVPWMFMSANLAANAACLPNLNPLMLSSDYLAPGGCGTAVPFPWLNVVDDRGNLLSSEVAIVLILPGPPVNNAQQRVSPNDRSPAAYLEGLTIAAGCPVPCVPGTYDNAAYTIANGAGWTFIDAPSSTRLGPAAAYYRQPFTFNDRMIYITASEYFEAMEQRARLEALRSLALFRATYQFLPYAGTMNPAAAPAPCAVSPHSYFGLLPDVTAAPCGATGPPPGLAYQNWFVSAGWGTYFIYAVDAGCVAAAAAPRCAAPTLRLGTAAQRYNAVLFSPGRAVRQPPYAYKGGPQTPIHSTSLKDFLDSAPNVNGPPFDAAGTLATASYNDRMYGIP